MQSRRIPATILALATAALAACSDSNNDNPTGTSNNNTTVRFFNATTTSLGLDIAQNGSVGTGNGSIAFGKASACTKVNNANPQLTVRQAGSTTNLIGFTPAFAANGTYTVLVTGTAASPVFTQFDDAFTTPSSGNAAIRIINATTSGSANWDVYVNPGATLGTPNATAIGQLKASSYLTVPAGQANTIRLTNSGQTTKLQDISVPSMTAGTVQTIVVTDAAAGSTTLQTFTLPSCSTT